MELIRSLIRAARDERGASMAIMALGATVFIGMAAIAVDLGMLMTAKTQAQRAADAAAHAGAVALSRTPGNESGARTLAIAAAADNDVLGQSVTLQSGDVTFPGEDSVRAVVIRNQARGNPIGTFFARILGIDEVDLAVDAMARVITPGNFEVECLLPVTIQDLWREADGSVPDEDDTFDPDEGDTYIPWSPGAEDFTGYSEANIGQEFVIKGNAAGVTSDRYNPSWWNPWAGFDDGWGANEYRARIRGDDCGQPRSPGDVVATEPGNMVGPTVQGFRDLINKDPGAQWNDAWSTTCNCDPIVGGMGMQSPRVRPIPMWDPRYGPANGRSDFQFTNFAGIFVEEIRGQDVIGRFLGILATNTGGEPGEGSAPMVRSVQIIE